MCAEPHAKDAPALIGRFRRRDADGRDRDSRAPQATASAFTPAATSGEVCAPSPLRRLIHPEVRIIDSRAGIVDYVASDESIDSFKEIIRASGWRFTHFTKNAPFVDSHDYSTIGKCLGKVIDFRVEGSRLIERVQWAIDVPENKLAQIGWKMTQAGYLKAVSVGFFPVKYLTPSSGEDWTRALRELGLPADAAVRTIYTEQEQVELSCCIVGANPNALAKAWHAKAITEADLEFIFQSAIVNRRGTEAQSPENASLCLCDSVVDPPSTIADPLSLEISAHETDRVADRPAPAAPSSGQARAAFLAELQKLIKPKINSHSLSGSTGDPPVTAGDPPAERSTRN